MNFIENFITELINKTLEALKKGKSYELTEYEIRLVGGSNAGIIELVLNESCRSYLAYDLSYPKLHNCISAFVNALAR